MTEIFNVLSPGAYTTVQDLGRFGWQRYGVPPSGMLDDFAGRMANMLVGNPDTAALLELTFTGPTLRILAPATIALTGADMPLSINGVPAAGWRTVPVQSGDTVSVGMAKSGCRGYLAVSQGIDVPLVMDSRSCYVGAAIGGFRGRPLQTGDGLRRCPGAIDHLARRVPEALVPAYPSEITLRAIPGPQDDFFDDGLDVFFNAWFTVSPQTDRMGCRLQGSVVSQIPAMPRSIISEPSLPGGVQIPQDGQPIILLCEQTVGGYTKIATVISSDIWRVAQALPGDRIRFERIGMDAAHAVFRSQASLLERIRHEMSRPDVAQRSGCDGPKPAAIDWNAPDVLDKLIHCLYQT
jgi:biotin-dependent carboxylase-like uncharacterized protein